MIDCAYKRPEDRTSSLMIAAYVMAAICGICVIPLILLIVQWIFLKLRQKSASAEDSNIETADINNLLPETNESIDEAVSGGSRWPSATTEDSEQGQLTRSTQSEF